MKIPQGHVYINKKTSIWRILTRIEINSNLIKSTKTSRSVVHDIKSQKQKIPTVQFDGAYRAQQGFFWFRYFTVI